MLLMVWDHSQRVPTASSHSSSVKWKNMPFSSFIVVVGRFASSTNCLFMHSAERRFCCHTNFEVVEKARKGRRNVMTSDVHLSPINLHQKRKVRVENIIHVVCDKSWSKLIEYLRWFNFYFYFSATFHVNHFVVFIVSHVKPQEVIWYRDIKWNTPNHFNSIPISSHAIQQPTSHSLSLSSSSSASFPMNEHMWNSHQIDFDDFVDEMAQKSIYFEGFYDIYNLDFMLRCDARKMSRWKSLN